MTDKLCIRCYISGRVQGVWFRDSTKEQAKQLNISGWAKNLPTAPSGIGSLTYYHTIMNIISQYIDNYGKTIQKCRVVLSEFPDSKLVNDAILLMAKAQLEHHLAQIVLNNQIRV